jgi:hypothetical protein
LIRETLIRGNPDSAKPETGDAGLLVESAAPIRHAWNHDLAKPGFANIDDIGNRNMAKPSIEKTKNRENRPQKPRVHFGVPPNGLDTHVLHG